MSGKIKVDIAQRIVGYQKEEDASRNKLGSFICCAEKWRALGKMFDVIAGIVKASRLERSSFRRAQLSNANTAK